MSQVKKDKRWFESQVMRLMHEYEKSNPDAIVYRIDVKRLVVDGSGGSVSYATDVKSEIHKTE